MAESIDAVARARELNEQRMRTWNEGKALLDDAARRGGMNSEDRRKWQRINDRIDQLDRERDVYLSAERRQRESEEIRQAEFSDFGARRVERNETAEAAEVRRLLRAGGAIDVPIDRARTERHALRDGMSPAEARALAWDTGSIASGVPTSMARSLYEYLEASMAMLKAPTTLVATESGEQMKFPSLAAHSIGTQVSGQGTAFAGTDPTFSSTTMDAYKYGELVIVASEVIEDAAFDVMSFLTRDVGRALGRQIGAHLVTGTGSGQPRGLMTALAAAGAGSVHTGGSLIDPTYEKLVDTVYGLTDEYRASGSAGWLMKDSTAAVVRKIRDGAGGTVGAAMWQPSVTAGLAFGQPDTLLGFPVYTDTNVAALGSNSRSLAFVDFSTYYIRQAGPVRLEVDASRYFDTDQVAVRGKGRWDGDLLDLLAGVSVIRNV